MEDRANREIDSYPRLAREQLVERLAEELDACEREGSSRAPRVITHQGRQQGLLVPREGYYALIDMVLELEEQLSDLRLAEVAVKRHASGEEVRMPLEAAIRELGLRFADCDEETARFLGELGVPLVDPETDASS